MNTKKKSISELKKAIHQYLNSVLKYTLERNPKNKSKMRKKFTACNGFTPEELNAVILDEFNNYFVWAMLDKLLKSKYCRRLIQHSIIPFKRHVKEQLVNYKSIHTKGKVDVSNAGKDTIDPVNTSKTE